MKRIVKIFMASICAMFLCATMSAQDLNQATDLFNSAATALNEGKNTEALAGFEKALKMAETLGDEGIAIVSDSKSIIPKILLQMGKEAANAKDLDGAIAKLKESAAKATEYGQEGLAKEATELIPQIVMADANSLLNEGKFEEAASKYLKVTELDPENTTAYIRIGTAKWKINDKEGSLEAFNKAAELGDKAKSYAELSKLCLAAAQSAYKTKKYDDVISNAKECLKLGENSGATFFLGLGYIGKKEYQKACVELKKIKDDPKFKDQVSKVLPQLQCK